MYDYVEVYGNEDYTKFLRIEEFQELFSDRPDIEKSSHASFIWTIGDFGIRIQGIHCDRNGNYSFNSDHTFKQVNLIEFCLPQHSESIHDAEIRALVSETALKIGWEIHWRE